MDQLEGGRALVQNAIGRYVLQWPWRAPGLHHQTPAGHSLHLLRIGDLKHLKAPLFWNPTTDMCEWWKTHAYLSHGKIVLLVFIHIDLPAMKHTIMNNTCICVCASFFLLNHHNDIASFVAHVCASIYGYIHIFTCIHLCTNPMLPVTMKPRR